MHSQTARVTHSFNEMRKWKYIPACQISIHLSVGAHDCVSDLSTNHWTYDCALVAFNATVFATGITRWIDVFWLSAIAPLNREWKEKTTKKPYAHFALWEWHEYNPLLIEVRGHAINITAESLVTTARRCLLKQWAPPYNNDGFSLITCRHAQQDALARTTIVWRDTPCHVAQPRQAEAHAQRKPLKTIFTSVASNRRHWSLFFTQFMRGAGLYLTISLRNVCATSFWGVCTFRWVKYWTKRNMACETFMPSRRLDHAHALSRMVSVCSNASATGADKRFFLLLARRKVLIAEDGNDNGTSQWWPMTSSLPCCCCGRCRWRRRHFCGVTMPTGW